MSRASAAHVARLDKTVKDLQNRVKAQEAALEKVYPSDNGFDHTANSSIASTLFKTC